MSFDDKNLDKHFLETFKFRKAHRASNLASLKLSEAGEH
jgi:hypothetical protein